MQEKYQRALRVMKHNLHKGKNPKSTNPRDIAQNVYRAACPVKTALGFVFSANIETKELYIVYHDDSRITFKYDDNDNFTLMLNTKPIEEFYADLEDFSSTYLTVKEVMEYIEINKGKLNNVRFVCKDGKNMNRLARPIYRPARKPEKLKLMTMYWADTNETLSHSEFYNEKPMWKLLKV